MIPVESIRALLKGIANSGVSEMEEFSVVCIMDDGFSIYIKLNGKGTHRYISHRMIENQYGNAVEELLGTSLVETIEKPTMSANSVRTNAPSTKKSV